MACLRADSWGSCIERARIQRAVPLRTPLIPTRRIFPSCSTPFIPQRAPVHQLNAINEPNNKNAETKADDKNGPGDDKRQPQNFISKLRSLGKSKADSSWSRYGLFLLLIFILSVGRDFLMGQRRAAPREVLYSDFVSALNTGNVASARLESGSHKLYFDIKPLETDAAAAATAAASVATVAAAAVATTEVATTAAATAAAVSADTAAAVATSTVHTITPQRIANVKQYYVKLADKADPMLVQMILASGVKFAVTKASFMTVLTNAVVTAIALWIPLIPLFFILRNVIEKSQNNSRKKKPSTGAELPTITFKDVAGVDSAKQELAEVVSCLKNQKQSYTNLKVKMPSGVLLCGPPGTGKTLLAKAVAGEAGIPFLAVSASEFVEMFVGRGAARIRELFAEARKNAPCVVFIDELDAVGGKRGMGFNDERDQTLNQLLTELDGFEGRSGVLFLAATNRIEVLDPALLRPGRINRKVTVPLPDEMGRTDILGVHMRGVPFESEEEKADIQMRVARVTPDFSGAELANVVNEACLMAARREQDYVTLRDFLEGVSRTKFGVNGRPQSGFQARIQQWAMDVAMQQPRKPVKVTAT